MEDIRIEERVYDMCANSHSQEIFEKWKIYLEQLYPYQPKQNIEDIFSMFPEKKEDK